MSPCKALLQCLLWCCQFSARMMSKYMSHKKTRIAWVKKGDFATQLYRDYNILLYIRIPIIPKQYIMESFQPFFFVAQHSNKYTAVVSWIRNIGFVGDRTTPPHHVLYAESNGSRHTSSTDFSLQLVWSPEMGRHGRHGRLEMRCFRKTLKDPLRALNKPRHSMSKEPY